MFSLLTKATQSNTTPCRTTSHIAYFHTCSNCVGYIMRFSIIITDIKLNSKSITAHTGASKACEMRSARTHIAPSSNFIHPQISHSACMTLLGRTTSTRGMSRVVAMLLRHAQSAPLRPHARCKLVRGKGWRSHASTHSGQASTHCRGTRCILCVVFWSVWKMPEHTVALPMCTHLLAWLRRRL